MYWTAVKPGFPAHCESNHSDQAVLSGCQKLLYLFPTCQTPVTLEASFPGFFSKDNIQIPQKLQYLAPLFAKPLNQASLDSLGQCLENGVALFSRQSQGEPIPVALTALCATMTAAPA